MHLFRTVTNNTSEYAITISLQAKEADWHLVLSCTTEIAEASIWHLKQRYRLVPQYHLLNHGDNANFSWSIHLLLSHFAIQSKRSDAYNINYLFKPQRQIHRFFEHLNPRFRYSISEFKFSEIPVLSKQIFILHYTFSFENNYDLKFPPLVETLENMWIPASKLKETTYSQENKE